MTGRYGRQKESIDSNWDSGMTRQQSGIRIRMSEQDSYEIRHSLKVVIRGFMGVKQAKFVSGKGLIYIGITRR